MIDLRNEDHHVQSVEEATVWSDPLDLRDYSDPSKIVQNEEEATVWSDPLDLRDYSELNKVIEESESEKGKNFKTFFKKLPPKYMLTLRKIQKSFKI